MTLVPSIQFYPSTTTFIDSFQNPVYGTVRLKLTRYNSLPLFHAHESFSTYPNSKPNSRFKKREIRRGFSVQGPIFNSNVNVNSSRSSWLEKCNDKHLKIRPKPHQAVMKCRKDLSLSSMRVNSRSGGGSGDGGGGGSTMEKIVEKLKKFGYMDDMNDRKEERRVIEKGSIEDIFYVEEDMMPNRRGGFSEESPLGVDNLFGSKGEVRFPWEKGPPKDEDKRNSVRERSRTSLAELTLPESELKRLRSLALRLKTRTRIKGGGLTNEIVDIIHEKWKSSEVVRLKIEGAPALNMKKMHEILERKTNGLVIWRSGTAICLYRGVSYEDPSTKASKRAHKKNEIAANSLSLTTDRNVSSSERGPETAAIARQGDLGENLEVRTMKESSHETEYQDEVDKLLAELGPRYLDWPGDEPLPVDADLLPGTVPGYRPPFRVLPYGVRGTLSVKEATALRRVARVLPPHFALGRSRQHEGLAVAMTKLWERSSIAKVALKRGVQLTTSERMAEDIKNLTGGMLLSTNKDYLVFYRGKDFLTPEVAEALLEKERLGKDLQDEEEHARLRASSFVIPDMEIHENSQTTGTLKETLNADARWGKILDENHKSKVMREAEFQRYADVIRKLENKLAFAERRVMKAERTLSKVEESLAPLSLQADPDSITDEERFMFRKLGLRMKAFLLLGRRGVFGGTVENMHLHWKYRELVKIIVKAKDFEEVKTTALSLEAESGGVLVSVDKVSKGYAIIVFRGKDYSRPSLLRPKNLLTKRKALARSIELQRREALLKHIATLQARTNQLRSEIEQMASLKESGNEELFEKIDSAYSSADEESEDEDEVVAYIESGDEKDDADEENDDEDDDDDDKEYDSEDTEDDNDEADQSLHNLHLDTNFPYNFQDYESEETTQNSSNLQ